jgi:hypothetical protein
MTTVSEVFDKTLSETLMDVYWKALEPFTDEQCEKAFSEVIVSSRFFPKPVDIIEKMQKEDKATEAWVQVLKAMQHIGTSNTPKFHDPAINSTIEVMGGWMQFARMEIEDQRWQRKEFEDLYPAMKRGNNQFEDLYPAMKRDNNHPAYRERELEPVSNEEETLIPFPTDENKRRVRELIQTLEGHKEERKEERKGERKRKEEKRREELRRQYELLLKQEGGDEAKTINQTG